jgi:hypothetical protein
VDILTVAKLMEMREVGSYFVETAANDQASHFLHHQAPWHRKPTIFKDSTERLSHQHMFESLLVDV